jgi:hypothetical protein
MYKDSVKNLAAKMTKKKTTNGTSDNQGTADTQARRAKEQAAAREFTGSKGPDNQYRTTGSSVKKVNDGKRIVTMKDMEGLNRRFAINNDGSLTEVQDLYKERIESSDAIVTPRTRR